MSLISTVSRYHAMLRESHIEDSWYLGISYLQQQQTIISLALHSLHNGVYTRQRSISQKGTNCSEAPGSLWGHLRLNAIRAHKQFSALLSNPIRHSCGKSQTNSPTCISFSFSTSWCLMRSTGKSRRMLAANTHNHGRCSF